MNGEGFCEACGFEHDDLICRDCGRPAFHFLHQQGQVVLSVTVACSHCDSLEEWPTVRVDDDILGEVEESLARGSVLPSVYWDPAILN